MNLYIISTEEMTHDPRHINWYIKRIESGGVRVSFLTWRCTKNICLWQSSIKPVYSFLIQKYNGYL